MVIFSEFSANLQKAFKAFGMTAVAALAGFATLGGSVKINFLP